MKPAAINRFRHKLCADESVYGLWITLEAAASTEIAVGLGLDWIAIEADNGHLGWAEIQEHVRAAARSHTVVLLSLGEVSRNAMKRALAIGVDGILMPQMETAAQLQTAVRWAHEALPNDLGDRVLLVSTIEAAEQAKDIGNVLTVTGVDAFFVEHWNCSRSTEYGGGKYTALSRSASDGILHQIRKAGKAAAIVAFSEESLADYRDRGFRVLAVGCDKAIIFHGMRSALDLMKKNKDLDRRPSLGS